AIEPLPPPAPGEGVQLHMPRWILEPHSEHEVCFASYYDLSAQIPAEYLSADQKDFRLKRSVIRQDPLSHHLFANPDKASTPPSSPVWGAFACRGGAKDGTPCVDTDLGFCGSDSECATAPQQGVGCIGFGPGDAGFGFAAFGITGSQETASDHRLADGVY